MTRLIRITLSLIAIICCWQSASAQNADFSFSPDSGCAPTMVVTFTDLSDPSVTSWAWNFGGAGTSPLQNPVWTFTNAGTYAVTLTTRGPNGTSTKTKNVTVFGKPTVALNAAVTAGCAPFAASFTSTVTLNGPGPGTYTWDFGDGTTGTGATTSHTYTQAGVYGVTLTVVNGAGCDRSVTRANFITANAKPTAVFSADSTLACASPATFTFRNQSYGGRGPYTVSWNFGDNTTSTLNPAPKTYAASGYYTVALQVTDANGCTDQVTMPNYIAVVGQSASATAPVKACMNQDVSVSNTTSGAVSFTSWDFGDGKPTVTGNTATHVYDAPGTYWISMTTTVGGCPKPWRQQIVIHPSPAVTIVQSPSIPCPAPVNVTFTGSPTGSGYTVASYNWVFKAGGTYAGQTIVNPYTRNIQDEVKLFTISSEGCRDSILVDTIMIRDLLGNLTPGSLCDPDTIAGCNPHTVTVGTELYSSLPPLDGPCAFAQYPVPDVSWKWTFGDGVGTSTFANPSYQYTTNGSYQIKVVITTANGCKDSMTRWAHVDSPVSPSFYMTPTVTCPKEQIAIHNTTANHKPGTIYVYDLDIDTVITKLDNSITYGKYAKYGLYTVRMSSNYRGCRDTFSRRDYIRVHPPSAKFTDSVYCYPFLGVALFNQSDSATSYTWYFGDGASSTDVNPRHTYATTGDYVITLVAYNSVYNCYDTFRKTIHIFKPDINFVADDTAVCKGAFVTFQGAFGGRGEIKYRWTVDSDVSAWDTASSFLYQFNTIGFHTITLSAISGNNCADEFTRTRYVLSSGPSVAFDATPHVGCQPLSLVFTDRSTNVPTVPAVSKTWIFGNGDSAMHDLSNSKAYTYTGRGIYNPKLIIIDSLGCVDSLTRPGYVGVYKPTAVFTASDDSVCTFAPIRFRSFSTGKAPLRYNWDFGDGSSGSADTALHFYTKPGSYHVRLIVTDSVGCADTMHIQNDIFVDAPHAAFSMSDSLAICPPLMITFTNASTDAVRYSWNFGTGGVTVTVKDPVWTYSNAGDYNMYLVAINANGCTDTARRRVRVLGYDGAFTYTPLLGCAPLEVQFSTSIPGIPILTWDFGNGATATTTNSGATSYTYPDAGSYTPKVIFADGKGCSSLSSGTEEIRVDKLTANFDWTVPCEGVAFRFNDLSTGLYSTPNDFKWDFGGGATATGNNPQHTYPTAGTRQVRLTVSNAAGCTGSVTKEVYINPSPDLNAVRDTAICPADTAQLRASNAVTYTWSPAPQNPSAWLSCTNCQNPLAVPGGPGVYLVTGVDANGCIGHDSTTISIQIRTTASTGNGGSICLGESFRLEAEGAHKYEWLPSETIDSPFIASPLATPRTTTTYIVAAQEGTCLVDSQRITVVVHSAPDFSAGADKIIGLGSATTLEPKGNFTKISWQQPDTTLTCHDCPNPIATTHYTRTYVATAENEWGCTATDSVTVVVRCNGSLIFIPNTFTPNGDGKNDYFYPQGSGFDYMTSFRVFNRWGEMVFERRNVAINDERSGWDGSFKGQALIPDTYIYSMTGRCPTGDIVEFKGDVTIIR